MNQDLLNYFKNDSLAASAWQGKYAVEGEVTPNDMHRRLAKEFARIEKKYEKENPEDVALSEDTIYNLFKDFKYVVPQGSVMSQLGAKSIGSLSNCFVIGQPEDSYGGIFQKDEEMAQLMKRRGGVGVDISTLRPESAPTSNAAKTSTGAISFMNRFSNTTREVAQNGRRGALMISINVNHPDVLEFAKIKRDLSKVTGANISIALNNDFMNAVEADEDYLLRFPVDLSPNIEYPDPKQLPYNELLTLHSDDPKKQGYVRKVRAKELWDEIIKSAHSVAEPGLFFIDNHWNYSPDGAYSQYRGVTTNPCVTGETKILTDKGYFPITDIVGKEVNVWNGEEFSKTTPKITGENEEIIKIKLSDGRELKSTPNHTWYTWDSNKTRGGNSIKKETKNLQIGDRIEKYEFPVIEYGKTIDEKVSYSEGFYSGDGVKNTSIIWLYNDKINLTNYLDGETIGNDYTTITGSNRRCIRLNFTPKGKNFVPINEYSIKSRLDWLAGLIDSDGTLTIEGGIQIVSTNRNFLSKVQYLLSTLGCNSKVVSADSKGFRTLPDGKGGSKEYLCKETNRILIGAVQVKQLRELGINLHRIDISKVNPNRDASRFTTVISLEKQVEKEDLVYCFTEPKKHKGVFNGILTGQCGEIFMQPYDACRLIALNLFNFVDNPFTDKAEFNHEKFYEVTYQSMKLSDDLVDLELEHVDRIISKIENDPETEEVRQRELVLWNKICKTAESSRRTGLGFTALGDTLAALGLQYDNSEEAVDSIMRTKLEAELDCTIEMAKNRGSFIGYDESLENNQFYTFIKENFYTQWETMQMYGRRNVSWSTVAPTGTVSLLTQTTSGLEPIFQPFYMRRKKINPNDDGVRVDFTDDNGDTWQEFPVLHPKFKEWMNKTWDYNEVMGDQTSKENLQIAFEDSPWFGSTANDVDWVKRVNIQGIIQKYTTHSISSTVNLPNDVKESEVSEIYMQAWKQGLKGITVYRDGSRSGVLVSNDKKESTTTFHDNHAPRRSKSLDAKLIRFNNNKEKWIAFVGLLDNKPYEIFTGKLDDIKIPMKIEEGKIVKNKTENGVKSYDFEYEGGTVANIDRVFNNDYWNYAKLVSGTLRHGMPLHFAVDMVNNLTFLEDHINTWKNGVARTLKRFIPDGKAEGLKCQDCGSSQVIFEESCSKCLDCGSSKCG